MPTKFNYQKAMNVLLTIISLIVLILLFGTLIHNQKLKREISSLYNSSAIISDKTFNYKQLEGLPTVVQSYFKHVLKEGQSYINNVRLKHDGNFKTAKGKKWSKIRGKQYFTTKNPGFIWNGEIGIVSAKDMYLNDKGSLTIKLLNFFKIAEEKGKTINQGELLRWLGESVWFPTNLLPSDNLKWEAIDDKSAKLLFNYKDLELFYIVTFNDNNEIIKLETNRFMDANTIKPWVGECSNYQKINGMKIPFNIKATWKLDDGNYNYVDFNIKKIEYNISD